MPASVAAYVSRLPPPRAIQHEWRRDASLSPLWAQLREMGLLRRVGCLLGVHLLETLLVLASWAFIGSAALRGRVDEARIAAWALCLVSVIPLRLTSRWLEGTIAIAFGALLKQRLLSGAIAMDADDVRHRGLGETVGEVLETEALDRIAVTGGVLVVLAAVELLVAPVVLAWGAAASLQIALLIGWCGLGTFAVARHARCRARWTEQRLMLTRDCVEEMIAHRTRTIQQDPRDWHVAEDAALARYAETSKALDRSVAWLESVLPRSYTIASLACLAPTFLSDETAIDARAVTLGAILFASQAFQRLMLGSTQVVAAWIAWKRAEPIVEAAGGVASEKPPVCDSMAASQVIRAEDVSFAYEGRLEPVVQNCSLAIAYGDFVLLEGQSGSGKSTFASLLAGMRQPRGGVILADGLDRASLGARAWSRRIAAAPQYHENHIFSASLAFNLLLARPYPHSARDLADAREVCEELGLGPLIERMPGGLEQMVGETGWQLSQGERSRVFLARALLQSADLVLLDETLAALDPETLRRCLECVFRRAKAAVVVAHP